MLMMYILAVHLFEVSAKYIYYQSIDRRCLPYYNCEPDHEILPCSTNFGNDLCEPCKKGFVQPDLISSSEDLNTTSCFKPSTECLAQDITYLRHPKNAFCESLKGCKCDTAKCHYGDPCLCDEKREKCAANTTLNNKGKCIPCPDGTMKNTIGCGPCYKIVQNSKTVQDKMDENSTRKRLLLVTATSAPFHVNSSPSSLPSLTWNESQPPNDKVMIIFMVVLGVLAMLLAGAILLICMKRTGFVVTGVCWTTHPHGTVVEDHTDRDEEKGMLQTINDDGSEKINNQTFTGNITTNPTEDTDKAPLYPDLSSGNPPAPKESSRSPCESGYYGTETTDFHDDISDNPSKGIITEKSSLIGHETNQDDNLDEKKDIKPVENDNQMKEFPLKLDVSDKYFNCQNLSSNCSPIAADTEPHSFPNSFSQDSMCSGSYISMYAGSRNNWTSGIGTYSNLDSDLTEQIPSALEHYAYDLKEKSTCNSFMFSSHKSDTKAKHNGPNSIDSGVSDLLYN